MIPGVELIIYKSSNYRELAIVVKQNIADDKILSFIFKFGFPEYYIYPANGHKNIFVRYQSHEEAVKCRRLMESNLCMIGGRVVIMWFKPNERSSNFNGSRTLNNSKGSFENHSKINNYIQNTTQCAQPIRAHPNFNYYNGGSISPTGRQC